jgi:hypothetical protein
MRMTLVYIQVRCEQPEGPEEKASRYTVRPGTLGLTLWYFILQVNADMVRLLRRGKRQMLRLAFLLLFIPGAATKFGFRLVRNITRQASLYTAFVISSSG